MIKVVQILNFLQFITIEHQEIKCAFSGFVFKSLFNLLEFQRLVLNYSPPVKVQDLPRNQKVCPLMRKTHTLSVYVCV